MKTTTMKTTKMKTTKMKTTKMKKLFLGVLLISISFISCETEEALLQPEFNYDKNAELKIDFAKAMSSALKENLSLREFLRTEALKMFDNDYDILYHMVKNEKLSDGKTVRDVLLSYYENEKGLSKIETEIPLLTIFIPELPENSFSAKLWDTQNQIPEVAVRLNTSNDVPMINTKGEQYVLEGGKIPAFPVLVVKENERVVYNPGVYNKSSVKGSKISTKDDMSFRFLDDAFDRSKVKNSGKGLAYDLDQKVKDAYTIYKTADGWQRDYIYYNLTPSNTKDQFSYDFQEHITQFSLNGDPMSAYEKISDQSGDPVLRTLRTRKQSNWTGGFFEFKVRVLLNAQNGIGEELVTFFSARPDQLFNTTYRRIIYGLYFLKSIELKTMNIDLPIFNWDLNQYASSIKIEIEEVDLTETTVLTNSRSVKFASNFSIDPTDGILKKIGLKFGASLETTETRTVQKTFTQGNDQLGSVIVNFADDVVINKLDPTTYRTRDYSTGFFKLSIGPKRVQN